MPEPLVSIIIPVKNGERFLPFALNSVFEQNYRPLEIIVVDGHSSDRTVAIAQSFVEVRVVSQSGQGLSNAWNEGLEAANGEFVAFLSYDDLWTPDKLRLQVKYLIDHPEIQYTIAKFRFFLEPGCAMPAGFRRELLETDHVGRIMETLVARQSLFARIGKFHTQLSTAEDVDWYARAHDRGIPMAIVPKVLLYKRVHDTNLSLNAAANNKNLLQALRQSVKRKQQQVDVNFESTAHL
jgi:glycosyltransferase involved in cell wall biosynthesis